ncbi:hypothetical protein LA080_008980 [Diaporthe eres]|nr:hypothetical protein LA080_008980 [Diaporthe eres]
MSSSIEGSINVSPTACPIHVPERCAQSLSEILQIVSPTKRQRRGRRATTTLATDSSSQKMPHGHATEISKRVQGVRKLGEVEKETLAGGIEGKIMHQEARSYAHVDCIIQTRSDAQ